ncbi:MAG: glutamate--tRNA ligase [Saprospiraceae bacterium]|nr:glutamate--tRNA ligase [Saprospiraceae bacterium]
MEKIRVRFAPSPTGPLHIGGVRTALYNFLFARQNNGTFILRIEDTDQNRLVPGAEAYIIESLTWFGLIPDEGPGFGGNCGPYRQSERKALYKQYVDKLIADGNAYYAFDTADELEAMREIDETFKYGIHSRMSLKNSLSLSAGLVEKLIKSGENVAVRIKIPANESISFFDEVRGHVAFDSNELDDKVIMKGDGMPTYHMANIVDDHLMKISHVIRGEEWLSSTAHHVLLYRFFGWEAPKFAHLPLILKPTGNGKLSKRDGAKFGFPVFPISWDSEHEEDNFTGFREDGYMPEAVLNFLAMLGWSPGNDQEIFSIEELIKTFRMEKIVKSGARFDIDKARWFNQQYLIQADNLKLAYMIQNQAIDDGYHVAVEYLAEVCALMKERVHKADEIIKNSRFFFEAPNFYDEETIKKKFSLEQVDHLLEIADKLNNLKSSDLPQIEITIKGYIIERSLKMGEIMPIIRIAISGSMQGPDLIQTIALIGTNEAASRLKTGVERFKSIKI